LQSSQQPVIQASSVKQKTSMMKTSLSSILQHNQQSNNVQQLTQSVPEQHSQLSGKNNQPAFSKAH